MVCNAIEREAKTVFDEARREGRQEAHDAYLADALVNLVQDGSNGGGADAALGTGRSRRVPRAEIVLHVSAEALRRISLEAGEFCEIPGVGPVPLASVEYLFGNAFAKLVVRDGVDILSISHVSRYIPQALDTAVRARDRVCVVPGCGIDYRLERDHVIPVEKQGPTELANLAMLCRRHHYLKTHKYWDLRGGPGHWEWVNLRPDQPIATSDDPCAPAAPGEPTVGLARALTPIERSGGYLAMDDEEAPVEDDSAEDDPPPEPDEPSQDLALPASYRQQTFACRGHTVVIRLAG